MTQSVSATPVVQSVDPQTEQAKGKRAYPAKPRAVYLMGTCLVDSFYADAGLDAIRLLEGQGVQVIFPQSQTCCGQPAYNSGYDDEARSVARVQLQAFAADIPVVVMMGSCAGMVHKEYPALFAGQPEQADAEALAARTYEFSEFLVNVLHIEQQLSDAADQSALRVALHTSCSARRGMGVAAEHKALVENLPGVQLVEPERVAECCGFGGTFAVKQPAISAAMAADKASAIAATNCKRLVSADCGCLMNIGGTLEKQGRAVKTQHLASLLYERLSGKASGQEGK
ncbi:(Fe-S)-binding protein [Thalassolituus sp. LLYu03]|uniref:(Fe-S)-binding protein n=1 Tax=Thalassolituus sp. LLYu03 TaxID=3421656 RepID=UPI003D2901A2